MERNGYKNIWTQKTTFKAKCYFAPFVILWGMVNHVFTGVYYDFYDFTMD